MINKIRRKVNPCCRFFFILNASNRSFCMFCIKCSACSAINTTWFLQKQTEKGEETLSIPSYVKQIFKLHFTLYDLFQIDSF